MEDKNSASAVAGAGHYARPATAQSDRLRVNPNKHGLGRVETAIMDMDDCGIAFETIATALGKTVSNVRDTVYRYRVDPSRDQARLDAAAHGSRELLRAQLRSGQHYLPPAAAQAAARRVGAHPRLKARP